MQQLVKGICNGTFSWKNSPYFGNLLSKGLPLKSRQKLNLDRCFEVGYNTVLQATNTLMRAMNRESALSKLPLPQRQDAIENLSNEIKDKIIENIRFKFPQHEFFIDDKRHLQETEPQALTDNPTWFIDPINGTTNFLHGFPFVSIGLSLWVSKQPVIGIVWNSISDQCFTARRGRGAFSDVAELSVSKQKTVAGALILQDLGTYKDNQRETIANIDSIASVAHGIRSTGSIPLNMCLVAQGYADAYCEFGCHAWEIAAAIPIVKEAGGVVIDPMMRPLDLMSRRMLCASTPELAMELSNLLIQTYPSRDDKKHAKAVAAQQMTVVNRELKREKPLYKTHKIEIYDEKYDNSYDNRSVARPRNPELRGFNKFRGIPKLNCGSRLKSLDGQPTDPSLPGQGTKEL